MMKLIKLTLFGDLKTDDFSNDIALIKTTKIQFNKYVKPIALYTDGAILPGEECISLGWGETYAGSGMYVCMYVCMCIY